MTAEANRLPEPLLARQREFLGFLRARLGSEERAEDVLQSALLKATESAGQVRDAESVVAWFYRLLRNAITDAARRNSLRDRALERETAALVDAVEPELEKNVCKCVEGAIELLPEGQRRLVHRVDLEGASVPEAAREEGITANNAGVRLHRARARLRDRLLRLCGACARHGCLDCRCRKVPA